MPTPPRPTTYWDYIRVEDLLALQGGLEDDEAGLPGEELLFITVHQIFELWFKLILRDLATARDLFGAERVAEQELSGVVARLKRITTIFRVATQHWEVVETLPTRSYLEFRTKLMPASGFQSAQMRRIEILLGLPEEDRIPLGPPGSHLDALRNPDGSPSPSLASVEAQLADTPTLREALDTWLARAPIDGTEHDAPDADEKLLAFIDRYLGAHAAETEAAEAHARQVTPAADHARLAKMYAAERASVRSFLLPDSGEGVDLRLARVRTAMVFIDTYRELPLLSWPREVLASLIELEQAFIIFRQRHARMVERVIGRRTGTGGSAGVDYLDRTAREYRVFHDLWAIRTLMIRPAAAPELDRPDFYDFASA